METPDDTMEIRVLRIRAYRAGQYKFNPPPVYSGNWDEEAWMNHVQFNDPDLTGFLPYDPTRHADALKLI
jgi:hypothetical protein